MMQSKEFTRKTFSISEDLRRRVLYWSGICGLSTSRPAQYGSKAVELLNTASTMKLGPSSKLVLGDGSTQSLPTLAVPNLIGKMTNLGLTLPTEQYEMLTEFAALAKINNSERVQRACRFANYLMPMMVDGQIEYDALVLEQSDGTHITIDTPFVRSIDRA
jgi:hypothetical protein